jgi:PhnB protein
MHIRPYLIFKGECQAAIDLYSRAFDTRVSQVMRFADIPANPSDPMSIPDSLKHRIVMATLPFGADFIRLSDTIGDLDEATTERINIIAEGSIEGVKRAFAVLSEEGTVTQPLIVSFFSPCYGVLRDKFGVMWVFSAVAEQH